MPARNPITGKRITTGPASDDYRANWDAIFKKDTDPVPASTGEWEEVDATDWEEITRLFTDTKD